MTFNSSLLFWASLSFVYINNYCIIEFFSMMFKRNQHGEGLRRYIVALIVETCTRQQRALNDFMEIYVASANRY